MLDVFNHVALQSVRHERCVGISTYSEWHGVARNWRIGHWNRLFWHGAWTYGDCVSETCYQLCSRVYSLSKTLAYLPRCYIHYLEHTNLAAPILFTQHSSLVKYFTISCQITFAADCAVSFRKGAQPTHSRDLCIYSIFTSFFVVVLFETRCFQFMVIYAGHLFILLVEPVFSIQRFLYDTVYDLIGMWSCFVRDLFGCGRPGWPASTILTNSPVRHCSSSFLCTELEHGRPDLWQYIQHMTHSFEHIRIKHFNNIGGVTVRTS